MGEDCPGDAATCPTDQGKEGDDALNCAFARPIAPTSCTGQTVPAGIAKRFARAAAIVDKATQLSSVAKQKRLLARAVKSLAQAANLVNLAQGRVQGAIQGDCADALRDTLADALRRVQDRRQSQLVRR